MKAAVALKTLDEVISVKILSQGRVNFEKADENIRSWKFRMPRDLYRTEWKYETTFRYHWREIADSEPEKLTVVFESFHSVEVTQDFHKTTVIVVPDREFHRVR